MLEHQLAAEHAVMRVLAESESPADALERLLQAICEGIGWDVGAAWLLDERDAVLRCEAFWHAAAAPAPRFEAASMQSRFSPGVGLPDASGPPARHTGSRMSSWTPTSRGCEAPRRTESTGRSASPFESATTSSACSSSSRANRACRATTFFERWTPSAA